MSKFKSIRISDPSVEDEKRFAVVKLFHVRFSQVSNGDQFANGWLVPSHPKSRGVQRFVAWINYPRCGDVSWRMGPVSESQFFAVADFSNRPLPNNIERWSFSDVPVGNLGRERLAYLNRFSGETWSCFNPRSLIDARLRLDRLNAIVCSLRSGPQFCDGLSYRGRNGFSFCGLRLGGDRQGMSIFGPTVNLQQLPASEAGIDNSSKSGDTGKNDNQLVIDRNRMPFLCERPLLGRSAAACGSIWTTVSCYLFILGICFELPAGRVPIQIRTLPERGLCGANHRLGRIQQFRLPPSIKNSMHHGDIRQYRNHP